MISSMTLSELFTNKSEIFQNLKDFSKSESRYRSIGLENFELPTAAVEDFRYSALKTLAKQKLSILQGKHTVVTKKIKSNVNEFVFCNGVLDEVKISNQRGLEWSTLVDSISQNHNDSSEKWFRALNRAFFENGLFLKVDTEIFQTIIIRHTVDTNQQSTMLTPRTQIHVNANCQVNVIEIFEDGSDLEYYINDTCDFYVEPRAQVQYTRVLNSSPNSSQTGHVYAKLGEHSLFQATFLSRGSLAHRQQVEIDLCETGAKCVLAGLGVLNQKRQCEWNVLVRHLDRETVSQQDFKNLLYEQSHAVFQGKVQIQQQAQQSQAQQVNKNLIVGDRAHVDTKPQLDVFADDVKATHGATVGRLNSNELFYLQSRAIPKAQAYKMLTNGFATSVFQNFPLRKNCEDWVLKELDLITKGMLS